MKNSLIKLIKLYQKHISSNTSSKCKYYPTCSNYAIEAIRTHGAFKGTFMAAYRILRCNPFSKGGYDPVPEKKKGKK
jgi:putative membrane protein insertion efficiency factor